MSTLAKIVVLRKPEEEGVGLLDKTEVEAVKVRYDDESLMFSGRTLRVGTVSDLCICMNE